MISVDIQQAHFTYRVAGVCIEDGSVLLNQPEGGDFWFLPGGRAEIMESSEVALRREMREELGAFGDLEITRLLWVVENFFRNDKGQPEHELGLYYQVALLGQSALADKRQTFRSIDAGTTMLYRWFPLAALDALPLYPAFLKTGLHNLPSQMQHIIHTDSSEE
jgi:ADP-ribose pyrophosphatase YjhB (NUDIX family)